jgi:glycosyltransferase domain-containing protein
MNLDESKFPLLEKLTIIVPTYNRQEFALRYMHYWSETKVTIIIIDGSKKSLEPAVLKKLKKNIIYIHNPIGIYQRLLAAIKHINTEYVLLGCDDEFYIPSALNSCLTMLSLNNQLISCGGIAMRYNFEDNSVVGFDCYPRLKNFISDDPNPNNRVRKHFSNYVPAHIYAVCRANIWKIFAQVIFSKEYSFYPAAEIQIEFLICYAGKTMVISELMWLRSNENIPIRGGSPSMSIINTRKSWWLDKKYENERKDFLARMDLVCRETTKTTDIPNFKFLIIEMFIKSKKGIFFNFFYLIYKNLPNFIKNKKFFILNFLKFTGLRKKKEKISFIDRARLLETEGVKIDFKELKRIEKIIICFHKNKKKFYPKYNLV